ncbi:hypothetical protein UFOVP931_5 [uncultured Caudovirales phage]|uniref:Uncharacterized protein n=1 Tax=uncultured Caudovirales phage TaxID=2100421 RepID=A0A6J5PI53_9CAUD|nr:hypothetical protein UFOVP931_5 [uncultured Caudovirales phage]CAB4199712.1 hypothetical protein UFOVP1358_11 [uncultured Caudovirales phage]
MPQINQLSALDQLAAGDQFPVYSQANGDARKVALGVLAQYIQAQMPASTGVQQFETQYAAPSSTGFNVQITDNGGNTHLILTPTAGLAAGTITLPMLANCVDKQEILVNCTQQVTALTINGNGAVAVTGEPTILGADDFFRLKFDITTQTWYRVG